MSDENLKLVITTLPATIASIASIIAAVRVNAVHKLVNSQYTSVLERLQRAMEKIAGMSPTDANTLHAEVAKQMVEDHKQLPID